MYRARKRGLAVPLAALAREKRAVEKAARGQGGRGGRALSSETGGNVGRYSLYFPNASIVIIAYPFIREWRCLFF